ncbi:hypothetical protein O9929_24495 [Vibrio lentus]|nr:hypothetical protein [Vibrio lentus]
MIGYGAVKKAFAITLAIGLLTSMFTGLPFSQMWMTKLWGQDNDKALITNHRYSVVKSTMEWFY